MNWNYPHYAVDLAIALAWALTFLFALIVLWIIAAKFRLICRVFGHDWDHIGMTFARKYECVRCDHHGYEARSLRDHLRHR